MATTATIKFYEVNATQPLLSVYLHYDGDIRSAGYALANWLKQKKMVLGTGDGIDLESGGANGIGCLAAQFVAQHKTCIGSLYITTPDDEQDYNYKVRFIDDNFVIEVDNSFKGSPDELLNY